MENHMIRSMNCAFGILAALTIVGCSSGGKDSGGSGGADGTTNTGCTVDFETYPASGATDWYFQSPVEAVLSEADATATITLSGPDGDVAGSVSIVDDTRVIFTPDADLTPSTEYSMSVSLCDGASGSSITFSTSELGLPVECDLKGKSYRVDLLSARFIQPDPSIASLLFEQLSDDILLGVSEVGDGELSMLGALSNGTGGQQNYCYPSIDFPTAATFNDPVFTVGPADTTLEVAGEPITISNLSISGAFAPDCTYFGGGKLQGELDARLLAPLVADLIGEDDPTEICNFLVTFGVTCGECSSDGQPFCADVEVDQIAASSTGVALSCVSEEECHPACSTSICDDPNAGDCNL
jgi:hypothetical protein